MKTRNERPAKIAVQPQFPTMDDAKIKEIETAALAYAEGRDARMAATEEEVRLKGQIIDAMHKHDKKEYRRGNIYIKLLIEKEKVKVKIKDEVVDERQAAVVTQ